MKKNNKDTIISICQRLGLQKDELKETLASLTRSLEQAPTGVSDECERMRELIRDLVKWDETNHIEPDLLARLKSFTPSHQTN